MPWRMADGGGHLMNSDFPPLARAAELLGGEVRGGEILCPGPGHTDSDRSLSVRPSKDNPEGFITHSFAADTCRECREHVRKKCGLPQPKNAKAKQKNGGSGVWQVIAEYIYRDERKKPYLLVKKCIDGHGKKQFPQFHWDGAKWVKGKPKGPKVPYKFPELLAEPLTTIVYICEGEKDADALAAIGLVSTTAPEGANAEWPANFPSHFRDRRVVVIVDADDPGRKHGQKVVRALDGVAASVKVIDLYPERNDGSDVFDWLQADTAGVKLMKVVKDAPEWEPSADSERRDEQKSDDELIAELAALDRLGYAKRRKDAAARIGVTLAALDKIVAEVRSEPRSEEPAHWQLERWPEPVATADLLTDLTKIYGRHVILPEHGATAMALWTLHAWAIEAFHCSPLLMFCSPEMRCGKSTAMSLLYWTGPRTVLASNISPAAIFRYIEAEHPTLLTDEAETNQSEEARGILNSGHTRETAYVIRCEGDDNKPKRFSTWAPKALASIGKLAATLRDRALMIPMKRKKRGQHIEKLRGRDTDNFRTLREKAQRWADDNVEKLKDARPALPEGLNDRAADNWEPLLAIAELAGGDWPMRARSAAIRFSGDSEAAAESTGAQLLRAIKIVFETLGVDRIASEDLAEELAKDKDSPWAAYGKTGKPITQRQIAAMLDRYSVRPDSIRVPGFGTTKKGYLLAWLEDAFDTYLDAFSDTAPSDPEHRNKPTATGRSSSFAYGIGDDEFRSENGENANNHGPCSDVPDRNSRLREEHENDRSAPRSEKPVNVSPSKSNGRSIADGVDANHPRHSDPRRMDATGWRGRI
jgi:5S rRNA maturation endonuclease (ribonuclease M5)